MKKFILSAVTILFLLLGGFFLGGFLLTNHSTNKKINEIKNTTDFTKKESFSYSIIENQPSIIQNYIKAVLKDSLSIPNFATINFMGKLKTDLNSEWQPVEVSAYFNLQKPNYLWFSEMAKSKLFSIKTIESYCNNKANVLIKLASSITIGDSWGKEIDKSSLFRYLSMSVYYPFNLIQSENLIWSVLDSNIVEIKFQEGESSIVAKLYFDENNLISKIETKDKYKAVFNDYEESLYTIYYSEYKTLDNGYKVPNKFELEWNLSSGKFKYGIFELKNIKYE
ncbi:MAG: hypothetical protein CR986_05980 [Ignavibacteriae bacterium]|nr:MAG: hypothetical protein CR986_05980 [Ignavibacteriota bacterium]